MQPQKGRLPGCGDICEGLVPLAECQRLCETTAGCDAISFHSGTHECYLKTNQQGCSTIATGKMCPWNLDRGPWEYYMRCACDLPGAWTAPAAANSVGEPKVVCGSDWGWVFLISLAGLASLYVAVGIGYSHKVHGEPLGLSALPHRGFWVDLRALVQDGIAFTKARMLAQGDGAGGYEKIAAGAVESRGAEQGVDGGKGISLGSESPAAIPGDSNDSDDLVE